MVKPPRVTIINSLERPQANLVNFALLRRIINALLKGISDLTNWELNVCLVSSAEITRLNETFLGHKGPTDVITFDYSDDASLEILSGEIVICLDEAFLQASSFGTIWQSELVRYVVHGILHLRGYDDCSSTERRKMKRAEEVLMRRLARDFDFRKLAAR
jgi:probable rRNA maturation factor